MLWWLKDLLREDLADRLEDRETEVIVSAASIWETAIKKAKRRLEVPDGFAERLAASDVVELPVTFRHARAAAQLPLHHRDPFDRMLIAQAQVEGSTLVTADRRLERYDVPLLRAVPV